MAAIRVYERLIGVMRSAYYAATAWVLLVLWGMRLCLLYVANTGPHSPPLYWDTLYALRLVKETYVPVLSWLVVVGILLAVDPANRTRWPLAVFIGLGVFTCLAFMIPEVRE